MATHHGDPGAGGRRECTPSHFTDEETGAQTQVVTLSMANRVNAELRSVNYEHVDRRGSRLAQTPFKI